MSKIASGIVKFNKQKSIPALVIDVVGNVCTVILSGRGKVLRNVPFTGSSPIVGDSVFVNYSTGRPIVETSSLALVDISTLTTTSQSKPTPLESTIYNTNHNDLVGLQGGQPASLSGPAEYLHLTEAEHAALGGEGSDYELPIATADKLGGIMVGSRLSIDGNGVLSANVQGGEGGGIEEAPEDSIAYLRKNADWVEVIDGGDTVAGAANPEIATLMHFTGDNNSTVFTDDNSENSWVQHGTAKIVTGDYKWSPSSALFDDTAACRITTSNSKFNLADHDFTIDFFVKFTAWQSWYNTVCAYGVLSGAPNGWAIIFKSDHMSFFYDVHSYNSYIEIGPKYFNFSLDTWYYIRICRTGGKIYFFVNGNLLNTGGTALTATFAHVSGDDFLIGDIGYGDHYMNLYGYVDEFRVINGTALSTASFSVPTGPGSITDGAAGQVTAENVIQFRRGLGANLPTTMAAGEPYFSTDEGKLYIGKQSTSPVQIAKDTVLGNASVTDKHLAVFDGDGYHLKDGGAIPTGGSGSGFPPFSPDAPPDTPDDMDDEFEGGALDGKWTSIISGSAPYTITVPADGTMAIFAQTTFASPANYRHCDIWQSMPADATWRIRAKLSLEVTSNYVGLGLGVRNSGSNVTEECFVITHPSYFVNSYFRIALNGESSLGESFLGYFPHMHFYEEIEKVSSTLIVFRFSITGYEGTYFDVYHFNESGLTPNQVGIIFHPYNSGNLTVGASCDWFRRMA